MTKILVVADEVDDALTHSRLGEISPDLVVSCGDLPFDHLEMLVDVCNVPLLYVPGNHDPALKGWGQGMRLVPPYIDASHGEPPGPRGCTNIDGRIVHARGLKIAGLGGSPRYRPGPNQYTERQMWMRTLRLRLSIAFRSPGPLDLFAAHSPPRGVGDDPDDPAHRGFRAFHDVISSLSPALFVHGHVHPYGRHTADSVVGSTTVVNAIPHRVLEVEPERSVGSRR